MSKRRPLLGATRVRRVVQVVLLLAFLGLVALAGPSADAVPRPALKAFFLADPLILIATWLAAHTVPLALLASLALVGATLVLGRVFCGWLCPLGTIHALAGRCFDGWRRNPRRRDLWSPWQAGKYYVLVGLLVMAALGGHWVCIMDPLVLLYRTTTTVLFPGVQWAAEEGSKAVFQANPGVGSWRLTSLTEPPYQFLREHVLLVPKQAFLGSGLLVAFFLTTVLLNGYRRRFWCRYLCPLGALLGLCSRWPLLRRRVEPDTCNQCGLCATACHGAAAAAPGQRWKPSECFGCYDCGDSCARGSLGFRWSWPWRKEPSAEPVDLSKRAMFGAALGGVATLSLLRSNPQSRGTRYHAALIRPPGARTEREFLERCTACGLCMKVCPTGGLQPSLTEAGLEGLWTPRLVPGIGYCDYNCTMCGQVCPTEAITPLTVEAKRRIKIGLAAFDTTRCIPYAYGRDCMVCEEHCPVPDKALYFLEVEIRDRDGKSKKVKQPHIDPELCTGCGVCENVCPYKDRPGVRVSSANETRNPENQPILPGPSGDFGESGESPY